MSLLQENADFDSDTEIFDSGGEYVHLSGLQIKSVKMPPLSKHKWIQLFFDQVKKDLSKVIWKYKGIDNLTREERRAWKELEEASDIVIKGSKKGGNIVLLTQEKYEQEVMRLLLDKSTYRKLTSNPFRLIVTALNNKLSLGLKEDLITKKEYNYLKVLQFNTPMFYIIPKLHKSLTDPPGRPIVSAINGPLEKIGKFTNALIKELVHDLPSYVQDTRDVLHRLDTMILPAEAPLVGIDVESLYTSIPHN